MFSAEKKREKNAGKVLKKDVNNTCAIFQGLISEKWRGHIDFCAEKARK